tara:strand:+ start:9180 stop:9830 length:651 start_codon:yes stop_codon:yes gene_type:complete
MGVVIITNDPDKYTKGETVYMQDTLSYEPKGEGITYVLNGSISKTYAGILAPYVDYRLVVTPKRKPTFTSTENILIDWVDNKTDMSRIISGIHRFPQRDMVFERLKQIPMPYLLAATSNILDYRLWQLVAKSNMVLPDVYTTALLAYGVKVNPEVSNHKSKKTEVCSIPMFRERDKYINFIIRNDEVVANELRTVAPEHLPSGVKKRIQAVEGDGL